MAGQLLPPPGMGPPDASKLSVSQRIQMWAELNDFGEKMLVANLRNQYKTEAEVRGAYTQWYRMHMEEHDRAVEHAILELYRREHVHAR